MKKKFTGRLFFIVLFFICLNLTGQAFAEKYVIKAITAWPKNASEVITEFFPFMEAANKYLAEKYPGEMKIQYLGGPEVIPARDQAEAIRMGTIDMMFGTPAYYAGVAPAANAGKLSRKTSEEEQMNGANEIFDKIHRDHMNAAYLGRLGSEIQFQLYTIKPVKTLAELKGLRIRTSPMYVDFIKSMGGVPIDIPPGDVYQALERGVVDGFMWPLYSIRSWGWHEVAKYVVGPSFYKVCHPVLVNAKKWDAFPDHLKQALQTVLVEQAAIVDSESIKHMEEELPLLKQAGLEKIDFSPEEEQQYLETAYAAGWEGQLKMESKYTSQLKELLSK